MKSESSNEQQGETSGTLNGLVNLLLLGMINRFNFNFKRYNDDDSVEIDRNDLLEQCKNISYKLFAYRNAMYSPDSLDELEHSESDLTAATLLVLSKQIHDRLYQFHHQLLELPADEIADIIPGLDTLMKRTEIRQERPYLSVDKDIEIICDIQNKMPV